MLRTETDGGIHTASSVRSFRTRHRHSGSRWIRSQPPALADIGTATGYASDAGLDLSPLLTALASPGAITRGTAAYTTAQSCLADAQSSLGHSIGAAEATLSGTNVTNAGSADAGVAGLLAATDASGQLSSLVSAGAYVRRTATNLANAST